MSLIPVTSKKDQLQINLFSGLIVCSFFLLLYTLIEAGFLATVLIALTIFPSLVILYFLLKPVKEFETIDFFQPIIFLFINILLGVTLRTMWIVFSTSSKVEDLFTFGHPHSYFIFGATLINIGIVSFIIGYRVKVRRALIIENKLLKRDNWNSISVYVVCVILMIMSSYGIYIFLQEFGVEELVVENLSKKRLKKIKGTKVLSAQMYQRWLASQGITAFIIFFNFFLYKKKRFFSLSGLLLLIMFLQTLLFPFITNTRIGIIAAFLFVGIIWHYHRGLNVKIVGLAGSIGTLIVLITSSFRHAFGGAKNFTEAFLLIDFSYFIDIFIANRNLLGIAKTGLITSNIPSPLNYKYGETMLLWIYAPIPRSIWPGKPIIGVGAEPAMKEIFHIPSNVYSGIPPGIIAEYYWNFGIFGVIIGMFLLGLLLKWLYKSLLPYMVLKNKNAIVLYIYIAYSIGFVLPATSFSPSVLSLLMGMIPILISLFIINIQGKKLFKEEKI